jgi:hypothetical protein
VSTLADEAIKATESLIETLRDCRQYFNGSLLLMELYAPHLHRHFAPRVRDGVDRSAAALRKLAAEASSSDRDLAAALLAFAYAPAEALSADYDAGLPGWRLLRGRIEVFRAAGPEAPPDYVTLDMIAVYLKVSKKTLERMKRGKESPLPDPDVEGGAGRADRWVWANVRPWLEARFKQRLPERYPSLLPS